MFRLWITIVIFSFIFTAVAVFAEEHDVCKHEQKYSQIWYINGCDGEKLEIKKDSMVPYQIISWNIFEFENVLDMDQQVGFKKHLR